MIGFSHDQRQRLSSSIAPASCRSWGAEKEAANEAASVFFFGLIHRAIALRTSDPSKIAPRQQPKNLALVRSLMT
jgi:hypothetical protein